MLFHTGYPIADLNGASQFGFTIAQCTTMGGFRESAQTAFIDRFAGQSNPHLLLNTTVTKVIFESGRAVGVLAQFRNGTTIRINALKEVILSSGAINTPKILIHSGVGPSVTLNSVSSKSTDLLNLEKKINIFFLCKIARNRYCC